MEQLAIFGGTPVRTEPIYYGRQYIDEQDVTAVETVLRSDLVTCGPKVEELERKLCEVTGAKYAVMVSSGTAALHLAAMAAGIQKGDEAIVTPMTFAASANCILYCGGTPVFADIRPDTYNIDPESIRAHITEKTKAVVVVDFTGQAVELDEIRQICDEHKLVLIEDAAHAIGTKYKGRKIGSIADLTTFSFHPVKTVTAGEGGAVTTNDEETYHRLLRLRTHGITRRREEMIHPTDALWYNEQVELGYNYRMTDFQAALLISQLGKLDQFIQRRKEIVKRYDEAFSQCPELIVQKEIPDSATNIRQPLFAVIQKDHMQRRTNEQHSAETNPVFDGCVRLKQQMQAIPDLIIFPKWRSYSQTQRANLLFSTANAMVQNRLFRQAA